MTLVKICGLRTTDAAEQAIESGADLLGTIMVPNRKRTVDLEVAAKISKLAKSKRETVKRKFQTARDIVTSLNETNFGTHNEYFLECARLIHENGPFLVGVFRNQAVDEVFKIANKCGLDFIQLHGSENTEGYLRANPNNEYGIIKRFVVPDHTEEMEDLFKKVDSSEVHGFLLPLLDSEAGGEGQVIDWSLINELDGKFLLAGGLHPGNLQETVPFLGNLVGFDVSGGVEDGSGDKNLSKIDQFVVNARVVGK